MPKPVVFIGGSSESWPELRCSSEVHAFELAAEPGLFSCQCGQTTRWISATLQPSVFWAEFECQWVEYPADA